MNNCSYLQVKVIAEAWKSSAADVVINLRQRTLAPKQLDSINWRLNLQMAQATKTKMKVPNAMFELGVQDENAEVRRPKNEIPSANVFG